MKRYSCGAIIFLLNGRYYPAYGTERIALLRMAFLRQPLPPNMVLAGDVGCGQGDPITWEQCNWETCGERVTQ